jgi:hypothetical protein
MCLSCHVKNSKKNVRINLMKREQKLNITLSKNMERKTTETQIITSLQINALLSK